jgi:hypothetical protein
MDISCEDLTAYDPNPNLLTLFKKGYNQSSSYSDSDSDPDNFFPPDHPIRLNLHEDCLIELIKSPLARMEKEIIENYDIFLNCIFWQVKGLKGRSATRKAAKNIRAEYYNYNDTVIPPKTGVGITYKHMKNLDTVSDHDNDMVWNEKEGFKPCKSSHMYSDSSSGSSNVRKTRKKGMQVPKPSSRITRRNAAGPFYSRPQLEQIFENKDFEEYYKKGALIAKGAFGKVYLGETAQDPQKKKVAIKSTKLKHDPSRIHNIAIEIYLLETAAHPHVVKHIKSFYWEKQIWSVMEYCPGGALTSLRKVKLSEAQLRFLMQQILQALDHMHKNNIAHRDLKCANILLDIQISTTRGETRIHKADIKIGDFGLAALVNGSKSQTAMCGSRYWMSPEMIQRVGYDTKTDIYSCGCVMFELMTGKAPYRNQGGLLALFNHATKGCEPLPTEIKQMYSTECLSFFSSLVTYNQDNRPTAAMLLQNPWLWQTKLDSTVLQSALNTTYEIKGYEDLSIKRDKFKF